MIAASLLSLFAAASVTEADPDIVFSKWGGRRPGIDTVEVWLEAQWENGTSVSPHYVIRLTRAYRPELELPAKYKAAKSVWWATESTCPQALPLFDALSKLPSPVIRLLAMPSDEETAITVRADGPAYRLAVTGYYPAEPGRVEYLFGEGNPAANWIDNSFTTLAACWKSERPKQAG